MRHERSTERRTQRRVDTTLLVSYRAVGSKEPFDLSQTVNFSRGGMLLNATHEYAKGEMLEVRIVIPSEHEKVLLRGEVLDTHRVVDGLIYRTRIRFVGVPPATDAVLKRTFSEYNTGA